MGALRDGGVDLGMRLVWLRALALGLGCQLLASVGGAGRVHAQPTQVDDVMAAPPPEPPDSPSAGAQPEAEPAAPRKAKAARPAEPTPPPPPEPPPQSRTKPRAPAPVPKPAPAPVGKPRAPAPPEKPAAAPAAGRTAGAPLTAADESEPAPSSVVDADVAAPPPRPVNDGDYAGSADGTAAPQDDFDPDVQEYARVEKGREYSIRFDPLNWLLLGRLAFELEVSLFKYLSVQLTPIFVTAPAPIAVNYAGLDDPLRQRSNGLGPISGVSLGVGAWLWGEPFHGYVLRLEFTNYGYAYRTSDAAGTIDRVEFTERRLILFIGSHSRFGPFTFAGGFGLGYELNQVERCGLTFSDGAVQSRSSGCRGKQLIALDRSANERADLNGPLHPVYFQARFTLGVVF